MNSRILIKIGGRAFEGEQGFKELAIAIKSSHELLIPGVSDNRFHIKGETLNSMKHIYNLPGAC